MSDDLIDFTPEQRAILCAAKVDTYLYMQSESELGSGNLRLDSLKRDLQTMQYRIQTLAHNQNLILEFLQSQLGKQIS